MTVAEIVANWKKAQESGAVLPCPRCGKMTMKESLYSNALSRRADIYICDSCGTAEALEDFYDEREFEWTKKMVSDWFLVNNVYSAQNIAVKIDNRFFIRAGIEVAITTQDIDDIMATALEGGITYWCDEAEVVEKYLGEFASDQISRGGTLRLYDMEDDAFYDLTREKFLQGLSHAIAEGYATEWLDGSYIDAGNIDADGADVIIQFALFGEVLYG